MENEIFEDYSKKYKVTITTQEIKEIITFLNNEPFDENFTMLSFDEISSKDLKVLFQKVLKKLDLKIDIPLFENNEENQVKLTDLFEILNFPASLIPEIVKKIYAEDKAQICSVIYYLLNNFKNLQKRAYLGYYLAKIQIPEEFLVDSEIKLLYGEYQTLVDNFIEEHESLSKLKNDSCNFDFLKVNLGQLEKEREALKTKLKFFESKSPKTKEFQDLLAAISSLRKSQEEDIRISDDIIMQRKALEKSEENIFFTTQKFSDATRDFGGDISGQDILLRLQNEVNNLFESRANLDFEYDEKNDQVKTNEQKLSEPLPSPDLQNKQEAKLAALNTLVNDLDVRVNSSYDPEKEEKLLIFRQQVDIVQRKKEELIEENKMLLGEKIKKDQFYEKKIKEQTKESQHFSQNDLGKIQALLTVKLNNQRKNENENNDINFEIDILKKTAQNISGIFPGITEEKDEKAVFLNKLKDESQERLLEVSGQFSSNLSLLRSKIKPLIEEHKRLKNQIKELEDQKNNLKLDFDSKVNDIKNENKEKNSQMYKSISQLNKLVSQMQLYIEKGDVFDLITKMLKKEESNGGLKNKIKKELENNDEKINILKIQRERIKLESVHFSAQTQTFKELEELLMKKISTTRK